MSESNKKAPRALLESDFSQSRTDKPETPLEVPELAFRAAMDVIFSGGGGVILSADEIFVIKDIFSRGIERFHADLKCKNLQS